jgi:hypothetical protein
LSLRHGEIEHRSLWVIRPVLLELYGNSDRVFAESTQLLYAVETGAACTKGAQKDCLVLPLLVAERKARCSVPNTRRSRVLALMLQPLSRTGIPNLRLTKCEIMQ